LKRNGFVSFHEDRMTAESTLTDTANPGRSAQRRWAIEEAALELVGEVGYDRLSMDALAERAGVSKATIYRHWSGKAALVVDALRERRHQPVALVEDQGCLRDDLLAQLRLICTAAEGDEGALTIGLLRAMHGDPELAQLMRSQVLQAKVDLVVALVERAQRREELPPAVPTESATEAMTSVVLCRLLLGGGPPDEGFRLHLVDQIVLPILMSGSGGRPDLPSPPTAPMSGGST
jgi:AcrR family transcriptional regulator